MNAEQVMTGKHEVFSVTDWKIDGHENFAPLLIFFEHFC